MARVDAQAAAVTPRPLDSGPPAASPPQQQQPPAPPAAPDPTPGLPYMASRDEVDRLVATIIRGLGAARGHLVELTTAVERADQELGGTLGRSRPGGLPPGMGQDTPPR